VARRGEKEELLKRRGTTRQGGGIKKRKVKESQGAVVRKNYSTYVSASRVKIQAFYPPLTGGSKCSIMQPVAITEEKHG
jgi:hypothetical protein